MPSIALVNKAGGVLGWGLADDLEVPFLATFPLRICCESLGKSCLDKPICKMNAATFLRLFAKDFCDVQCHIEYDRKFSSIIQQRFFY